MSNAATSLIASLTLHLFLVVSGTVYLKLNVNMASEETKKTIRLVSFSSSNLISSKSKIQKFIDKSSATISTPNNIAPSHFSTNKMLNLDEAVSKEGPGTDINSNVNTTETIGNSDVGIKKSEATAIEIEVNKIRIFLEKYLDQRINQRDITFKIEVKFYKNSNAVDVNLLTDKLSDKNISMIKQVINKYQKNELLRLMPLDVFKVVIPIKIS